MSEQIKSLGRWDDFIKASMSLSALKFTLDEKGDREDKEDTRRSRALAEYLFSNPHRFVPPFIIDAALLGRNDENLFRRGTEWQLRGKVPDAIELPVLLELWTRYTRLLLKRHEKSSVEEKERQTWLRHDEFRCTHFFREGNGSTARFLLNHMRVLLGLPILVLDEHNAGEYHRRLDEYFENVFIPRLPELRARAANVRIAK